MPTAVERLLQAFLKLEIDNPFEQRGLTAAYANIDAELHKISAATNSRDLIQAERAASRDLHKIADAFLDTGEDLSRLARFSFGLDQFLLKIANRTTTETPAGVAGIDDTIHLQDDFLKLDAALATSGRDLKIFGQDIWKMDGSVRVADFAIKWNQIGDDAATLKTSMEDDQFAFEQLSADFLRLGGVNANGAPVNQLDANLGTALHKVALDFAALQHDFFDIKLAFSGDGGGSGAPALNNLATEAVTLLSPGKALSHATDDFLKLSDDFVGLAGPAAAGINALLAKAFGGGGGTAFP